MALLDSWHRRHHGSSDALSSTLTHRNIDAIGQGILHVSVVHLFHVGFALQVRCHEIRMMILDIVAIVLKISLIKIVARNTWNILQVMQRWDLRNI